MIEVYLPAIIGVCAKIPATSRQVSEAFIARRPQTTVCGRLKVSSQKRGETSRRFERLNQFFEETFGTVCPCPQNIEKIRLKCVMN
jgi:hypothetical protein